jgi:hypothetical protein
MKDAKQKEKKEIFEPPNQNDVFAKVRKADGRIYHRLGFADITEVEWKQLKEEAKLIKSLRIWRILQETVKNKALENAIIHNKSWEDIRETRGSYYTATSFDRILQEIINN